MVGGTLHSLNEDETATSGTVDLLDAICRAGLHQVVPAPTLAAHTKYWALAVECRPSLRPALVGGITMASTRYWNGLYGFHGRGTATASLTPGSTAQRRLRRR